MKRTASLALLEGGKVVITDDGLFIIDWAMHGLSLLRIIRSSARFTIHTQSAQRKPRAVC